jgi:hypothetical protein
MEIKERDEAYVCDGWESVTHYLIGELYRKYYIPMRRKIDNIDELFSTYNNKEKT